MVRNFLGKVPENPEIAEFLKSGPFNRKLQTFLKLLFPSFASGNFWKLKPKFFIAWKAFICLLETMSICEYVEALGLTPLLCVLSLSSQRGNTALHIAAGAGYQAVVKLLMEYGASPLIENKVGIILC